MMQVRSIVWLPPPIACCIHVLIPTAIPGRNYILHSEMIIFIYDALNSINTSCVNVTILDDSIPENTLYVTIGLFEESSNVFIIPARNQTKIAILDSDTGRFFVYSLSCNYVYLMCRSYWEYACILGCDEIQTNCTVLQKTNSTL